MKMVLISGLDRTGKSRVGRYFSDFGYFAIELGDIVRRIYHKEHAIGTISQFYELNSSRLEMDIVRAIEVELERTMSKYRGLALIGPRSGTLKNSIREKFGKFNILFLTSRVENRYKRYLSESDLRPLEPKLTIDEFRSNDQMQLRWGLLDYFDSADIVIENDMGVSSLKQRVLEYINKLNLDG